MADSILRLKVSSEEYDKKLKQAANELSRYVDQCRKVGGTLEVVEKETLEYVRAIGQMDTTSRTATGKLAEMKKTFVELSAQYKQMTDAEKASPFGKALSESLDELKPRIMEAKQQLDDINKSMMGVSSGGGGLFSGMGDKMSGALQVFAGNMMTKAAGAVAELGSEIFASVQQGIELARQGEGIRIAFERLGRGDILDGLRKATHGTVTDLELMKAAVKFNDFKLPLDELGTMLSFAQQKAKDTGQSVDFLVESIVNGLGRKSLMILDNLGLSATEIKERMGETGDMTKAVGDIIREQMAKAGDYVETAADRAAQANVSLQNKMEELGRKFAPVEEASSQLWTSMKIGILDIIGGPLATLLNQLTEAGRLKNMLNNMNGEPGSGNTKVDQQLKKLNVIKKAGGSDYIFNATLSGMMEDYNRQIMALDAQIKNGGKPVGGGSGSSQDVRYLQQKMDALKVMRDQLAAGAKELSKPVDVKIETKGAEQNVESLKVKLIELEAQRKKAIAAGDTDLSKNLAKQISQVKADIKGLGGTTTTTTTHKATPQETAANKVKEAERTYAETLLKNSIRLDEGMDSTLEYKKRELSAQERLFDAYNDAYATYQDPAYKKASTEAAEKIRALAGEVKAASDAQEAAMKSARELDAAQRKLADAQQKLAEARATGSATAVYKAQQEVDKRQKVVEQVQYVADVKAGKMPTLPENMKAEMVVTANTDEAVRALQAIQGITIDPKTLTITTDDTEALAKVREIEGITIDPKTVKIVQDVSETGEKSSFENLVETVQAEIKFDQMKVDETALHTLLQTALQNGLDGLALSGMMEDYNRQIMALDAQIKNGGKPVGGGSGSSQDVRYLQQKMDALKVMRDQLAAGAKELSKPVDVKIETKGAEQNVESLKLKLIELEAQRKKAIAAGDTDLSKNLAKQISQVKSDIKGLGGTTTTTKTHNATPQETAANKVKEAERTYAETLLKNSIRLEAGMDTTLEYKKRELSAQERLFDAYNDAYATYQDPDYKNASTEAAEKIRALAGEVKAASDAQEAARKSARELDAAQRKLADAQQKLAEARATGSATAVYKAQQEVDKRQKVVEQVQYVADVKAGKMPTLPENMKAEMVVTANTDEAVRALQAIQGITIDPKTLTITTDDTEALAKVREIEGITIDPKTVKIVQDVSETGEKSSFENLVETVQAEIKLDQMKVDETALHTLLQTALQNGLDGLALSYEGIQEKIAKGIDIPDSTWEELTNEINDKLKDLGIEPIEIPIETTEKNVKAIAKAASITADVVGSIGDAFNAIEDPAAKVAGTVMQAIASIALGYAQATVQATSMGPWAWIAFAAAGLATMISTISAIHSSTGYAEGGMIKGNSYSGDNIGGLVDGSQFVGLNAGEVVLNASQQNALAQQITGGGMGNVNLTGRLRGTDIILSVDRTLQSTGRGELLVWK